MSLPVVTPDLVLQGVYHMCDLAESLNAFSTFDVDYSVHPRENFVNPISPSVRNDSASQITILGVIQENHAAVTAEAANHLCPGNCTDPCHNQDN